MQKDAKGLIFPAGPAHIEACGLGVKPLFIMKAKRFAIACSLTAAIAGIIACAVSCAKKSNEPVNPPPPPPPPTNGPASNTNTVAATNEVAATNLAAEHAVTITNVPAAPEITNPPPAETTVTAPKPAETETNPPGHLTVVEMPTNPPVAPPNFYPPAVATNPPATCCLQPIGQEEGGCTNFFLRFRVGYEHIYHGDNNDSLWLSAKVYAYGDGLREAAGKNGWLIPDADAEISSAYLAKPDNNPHPGSDQGLDFRAAFTWPWVHWTLNQSAACTNYVCPFCQPVTFRLGPTVNVGFDHLYDESDYRFARYAGLRLTFNRSGFVEYTAGDTDGLSGTRQQLVIELPFYESRNGEVRYYLRGLWNHGSSNKPDIYEGGVFVEMPFSTLVRPGKWGDLVPFGH
jgi:hypothetical protein